MSGLGGFLFGNIDEEGRLDNEDLDDELKASLTTFVEKGFGAASGIFNLTSLGINEAEASGPERLAEGPETLDRVTEYGQETEGGPRIPGTKAAASNCIRFTDTYSLGTDDFKGSRFNLKRVRIKRRFVTNKLLHYSEDSLHLFKAIMFVPNSSPVLSRYRLLIGHIVSGQSVNQFMMNRKQRIPLAMRILESAFANYNSVDLFMVPCLDEAKFLDSSTVDPLALHPVQVLQWEDDIIWGEEDLKPNRLAPIYTGVRADPPAASTNVSQPNFSQSRLNAIRPTTVGSSTYRPLSALSPTLSALATVAPAALSALIAQQRRLSPSPQPVAIGPLLKNPATRVYNSDLAMGSWEEQIIWDEAERPPPSYPVSLILNMNDPNLHLETVEQEPLGKKISKAEKIINRRLKRVAGQPLSSTAPSINVSTVGGKPGTAVNYSRPLADRFNLSNDKFYEVKPTVQKSAAGGGKTGVGRVNSLQHSIPALKLLPPHFATSKSKAELRAWHRPRLNIPIPTTIAFSAVKPKKKKINNRVGQVIRNSKKLTVRDGAPFLVIEYAEEFPLLLQNPGMATHVILFYRKRSPKDPHIPTDPHALIRLLEPTDPSPLWTFGDVPMGHSLYVLSNNLYRTPLFPHTLPPTDFILVRNTDKNGQLRYYLRDLGATFLAGQVFPLMEIYSPHSRKHNQYCRNRLQVAAYRLFQKDQNSDRRPRLKASRLSKAFPQFSDGSIRKWLKEYAESQRAGSESGNWILKPDAQLLAEEDLRALVTPEMVCIYEAMLAGQQRLLDAGLINEANSGDVGDEETGSVDEDSMSATAMTNKDAFATAPWNLSVGFLNAINSSSGMVRLDGPGDPSGRGEMFSFVKGAPASLQVSKVTDDSSLADVFRKSRNNAELQTLFNQEKRKIWEAQVKALSSREVLARPPSDLLSMSHDADDQLSVVSSATATNRQLHRLVIKRSSTVNGMLVEQIEEVTDSRVIAAYLRQRRQFDVKRKRRANAVLAATASKQKKKRQREEQEGLFGQQQPAPTSAAHLKKPKKDVSVRCGACGALGHMRTNRICPMFKEETLGNEPAAVRVEGTKLSINAEALNRIVEQERSFKFKIQLGSLHKNSAPTATAESDDITIDDHGNNDGNDEDEDDEGDGDNLGKSSNSATAKTKRRKKLTPADAFLQQHPDRKDILIAFNDALRMVVDSLLSQPDSWPFHRPVSRRDYPHYYRMIAKPIDLGSMRTAAVKHKYLHSAELVAKVQLMANNCLQFNRSDHLFTGVAFRLLDIARELCSEPGVADLERQLHGDVESPGQRERDAADNHVVDVLQVNENEQQQQQEEPLAD